MDRIPNWYLARRTPIEPMRAIIVGAVGLTRATETEACLSCEPVNPRTPDYQSSECLGFKSEL